MLQNVFAQCKYNWYYMYLTFIFLPEISNAKKIRYQSIHSIFYVQLRSGVELKQLLCDVNMTTMKEYYIVKHQTSVTLVLNGIVV